MRLACLSLCLTTLIVAGCHSSSESSTRPVSSRSEDTAAPSQAGVQVVAWRSVREHPGAGPQAIMLQGERSAVQKQTECRQGGIKELQVEFSGPVRLTHADALVAETAEGKVKPTSVTLAKPDLLVIRFDGLKDGCYRVVLNSVVEPVMKNTFGQVRVLQGDTNGDGHVNLNDALYTKSRVDQAVSAANAGLDIDVSGKIAQDDVALAKAAVGKAIRCD